MMNRRTIAILILLSIALLSACRQDPEAPPTPGPVSDPTTEAVGSPPVDPPSAEEEVLTDNQPAGLLISEVLTGAPGANNHEFIELYNAGSEPVNLEGYSLSYLTREGQEETLLYSWKEAADIPSRGHYLLVHKGETFGLLPDALYEAAVFEG